MPDIVLTCERCGNPFVYSEYEQQINSKQNLPIPTLDPICQSLKDQEKKHPKKPVSTTTT